MEDKQLYLRIPKLDGAIGLVEWERLMKSCLRRGDYRLLELKDSLWNNCCGKYGMD